MLRLLLRWHLYIIYLILKDNNSQWKGKITRGIKDSLHYYKSIKIITVYKKTFWLSFKSHRIQKTWREIRLVGPAIFLSLFLNAAFSLFSISRAFRRFYYKKLLGYCYLIKSCPFPFCESTRQQNQNVPWQKIIRNWFYKEIFSPFHHVNKPIARTQQTTLMT